MRKIGAFFFPRRTSHVNGLRKLLNGRQSRPNKANQGEIRRANQVREGRREVGMRPWPVCHSGHENWLTGTRKKVVLCCVVLCLYGDFIVVCTVLCCVELCLCGDSVLCLCCVVLCLCGDFVVCVVFVVFVLCCVDPCLCYARIDISGRTQHLPPGQVHTYHEFLCAIVCTPPHPLLSTP